jgi:hypothetical protein
LAGHLVRQAFGVADLRRGPVARAVEVAVDRVADDPLPSRSVTVFPKTFTEPWTLFRIKPFQKPS